jgi:AraC family transcriptional regulator
MDPPSDAPDGSLRRRPFAIEILRMSPGRALLPAEPPPLDRIVFRGPAVTVGAFRCPAWHPSFEDSGPIQNDIFVFPRRTVRLHHEGGTPFLADPGMVTLYNRGQRYRRYLVSARGDDCEWFAVERGLLRDVIRYFEPAVDDRPERPFRYVYMPCPPRVYLAQRGLYERLRAGSAADAAEVEETVLGLLADVLRAGYRFWGAGARPRPDRRRQRELAEDARSLVSVRLGEALRLSEIAAELGVSTFHLCRAFRAATGETLQAYRNRLRLHASLERLDGKDDLTGVALDLGYSSHSHFSASFRDLFGTTPSAVRGALPPSAL